MVLICMYFFIRWCAGVLSQQAHPGSPAYFHAVCGDDAYLLLHAGPSGELHCHGRSHVRAGRVLLFRRTLLRLFS